MRLLSQSLQSSRLRSSQGTLFRYKWYEPKTTSGGAPDFTTLGASLRNERKEKTVGAKSVVALKQYDLFPSRKFQPDIVQLTIRIIRGKIK